MVTSWPIGVDQTPWVDELFPSLYCSCLLNIHVEKTTSSPKAENLADKFSPHICIEGQRFTAEGYQRTGAMYPRYSGKPVRQKNVVLIVISKELQSGIKLIGYIIERKIFKKNIKGNQSFRLSFLVLLISWNVMHLSICLRLWAVSTRNRIDV